MKSTIFIENLRVDTIIGICDWEQTREQPLFFDVHAQVDCKQVAHSDSIEHALDYADVAVTLAEFVNSSSLKLLEPLLAKLAEHLFEKYELIDSLELTVRKPEAIEQADCAGVRLFSVR